MLLRLSKRLQLKFYIILVRDDELAETYMLSFTSITDKTTTTKVLLLSLLRNTVDTLKVVIIALLF